jgi:cytoplasmic tRNA 2-thiolation protein 2
MESYGLRTTGDNGSVSLKIPTLLLPISFGVSSTTLLSFLDTQLKEKRRGHKNRTRYQLLVCHIDETFLEPTSPGRGQLDTVRERFPEAGRYSAVGLEEVYGFNGVVAEVLENEVEADGENQANGHIEEEEQTNASKLRNLLSSIPTTTSRMDIARILRTRLIVEVAKQEGCQGILWGDTATRLAEKTFAETAKGRGFSLPWQISDGPTPYGIPLFPPPPLPLFF